MWTVDAHCHLTDPRIFRDADFIIREMREKNIRGFLLGGVDPEDWSRQRQLAVRWPDVVWTSAGLHPYFVAKSKPPELDIAFAELSQLCRETPANISALGEIGLDFRSSHLEAGPEHQIFWFEKQLQLAHETSKPVILHVVRAQDPALKILAKHPVRGMVHAFNSKESIARKYLDLGLYLSIGSALLFERAEPLREAVRSAPLDRLLIESDAPDQAPPGQTSHDSSTVWLVAAKMAEVRGVTAEQIVEKTRQNLADFIGRSV